MSNPSDELRAGLLSVQEVSPTLRDAYQKELNTLLQPPLTKQAGIIGGALAVGLVMGAGLIAWTDAVHHIRGLMLIGHATLGIGLLGAAAMIFRDLQRRKHSRRSVWSIASLLTGVAGTLTVLALLLGMRSPADPKSMFSAFYVFVFYFACAIWALESRIATSELVAREHSLRLECRLADIAERLQK